MATLNVVNNYEVTSQGISKSGKQGEAADGFDTALELTVTGTAHQATGSLATDAVATVWDGDDDLPATWDYLHFWADQDCYIQIIGPAMNVVFPVTAYVPFTLAAAAMVAAASATAITGGAEPTMSDIDSVVIGNNSGSTMNYTFGVVD